MHTTERSLGDRLRPIARGFVRGLLVTLVPLAVTAGDCGDLPSKTPAYKRIEILLHNADGLPVHMFGPGEGFPCCQVPSQETRTIHQEMTAGNSMIFRAGRNGEILVQFPCGLGTQGYEAGSVSVVFNAGSLTCMGWGGPQG